MKVTITKSDGEKYEISDVKEFEMNRSEAERIEIIKDKVFIKE